MAAPLALGLTLAGRRRPVAADPLAALSTAGVLAPCLLPALSRSRGLLWQDTARTLPATADGDPVRVAVCPYTGAAYTTPSDARRPLLSDSGGGKWSLYFDGVDDGLQLGSPLLPSATGLSLFAAFNPTSTAGFQVLIGQRWSSEGTCLMLQSGALKSKLEVGGSATAVSPGTPAAGGWCVTDGVCDLSGVSGQSTGAAASAALAGTPTGAGAGFAVGTMAIAGGGGPLQCFSGLMSGGVTVKRGVTPAERTTIRSLLAAL